jgi:hypothetical protein
MQTTIDISSAVRQWCKGGFILRSSFYSGRGVNLGDLNSKFLEMIYQGLKSEVSQEAAKNFVKFVNNLKDLTASGFIIAFERFWDSECQNTNTSLPSGLGNQISGRGDERFAEGFALIGQIFGGGLSSPEKIERESHSVKDQFLRQHKEEITK